MLIEFSATNFRSIGDRQVLSLVPAQKESEFPENILAIGKNKALNAIAIYGANSSGKSNLIKAIRTLDILVSTSWQNSSTNRLPYQPFLLREGYNKLPTIFEIVFVVEESRYRYLVSYNETEILTEYLFRKSVGREVVLFARENDTIETTSAFKGGGRIFDIAIETTKNNTLFLSVCDAFNVKEAQKIMHWFAQLLVVDGLDTEPLEIRTASMWQQEQYKGRLRDHLAAMNLGMLTIDLQTKDFEDKDLPDSIPDEIRSEFARHLSGSISMRFSSSHHLYSADKALPNGETIVFDWEKHESAGSKKILQLSGPVIWALTNGGVLVIDEIEAKSHPILTLKLIKLFLSKESNPNGAQLIFVTHDTNVLTYSNLRLDQIYFAEKNSWESTQIYSLSDFEDPTPLHGVDRIRFLHKEKERRYLEGRFGAIPFLIKK